jgi:hypothetical protein
MTKEEFKQRWEYSDCGNEITFRHLDKDEQV